MKRVITDQPRQAMPRLQPRKGFAALPGSEQLAVISMIALMVLALWPGLLDGGRMRSAADSKDALKPKKPGSAAQFAKRLEEHYRLSWLAAEEAGREQAARLLLSVLQGVALLGGAVGGEQAKRGRRQWAAPLSFGAPDELEPAKVRARAAL